MSAASVPCSDTTTPSILSPNVSADHSPRSPPGATTCASTIFCGCIALGLGGRGKLSPVPVLGGVNTESGSLGRDFGPLRRAPTPGEGGTCGIDESIWRCGGKERTVGGSGCLREKIRRRASLNSSRPFQGRRQIDARPLWLIASLIATSCPGPIRQPPPATNRHYCESNRTQPAPQILASVADRNALRHRDSHKNEIYFSEFACR